MLEKLLNFTKEIDLLKKVDRKALIHNGGRLENSAEHSWHLAMAVLTFQSEAAEKLDLNRALQMALIHDIVEIDAGDTFIYADQSSKAGTELAAAERIFGLLPEHLNQEFQQLWQEFERKECPESRFVGALDRFLPLYSNLLNQGYSWKNHGIRLDQVLARNQKPIQAGLPTLWPFVEEALLKCVERGDLAPSK